jgi:methylglutaconyl-CoA hydratase
MKHLIVSTNKSIATVTINRPDVRNAFNTELTKEFFECFTNLNQDDSVRAVILTGEGKCFCAGADLNYMKSAKEKTREQNIEDSLFMAKTFQTMNDLSKPLIGLVNGHCFAGGLGLVSVCDIVLAQEKAIFCLSEAKLGMTPAVISQFVIQKIGVNQARRYFVTAERFSAEKAKEIGLVNEVYAEGEADKALQPILENIYQCSPNAMGSAKILIQKNKDLSDNDLVQFSVEQIADLRASDDAQEGMGAFFEKRTPSYVIK